jgi:hypothetical protein
MTSRFGGRQRVQIPDVLQAARGRHGGGSRQGGPKQQGGSKQQGAPKQGA